MIPYGRDIAGKRMEEYCCLNLDHLIPVQRSGMRVVGTVADVCSI